MAEILCSRLTEPLLFPQWKLGGFWVEELVCFPLGFININYRKGGILIMAFFCVGNVGMKSWLEPWSPQTGKQ